MRIAVASDHRGFRVKTKVVDLLQKRGHEVCDLGTDSNESVDYPDFAAKVARLVADGQADRGILICGTGLGMTIAANKIAGIRATPVTDELTAELSRRHNDSNVLCLSGDLLGERQVDCIVDIWLKTVFEAGRHARRIEKIRALEHAPCSHQTPPAEPGANSEPDQA